MISQLNFSAFSVEMDSVEQISPEWIRQAAAAQSVDDDSSDYRIIPMVRSDNAQVNASMMDDDRDLLIVEEEVPASMRHQAPAAAVAPTTPNVSLSQLVPAVAWLTSRFDAADCFEDRRTMGLCKQRRLAHRQMGLSADGS